MWWLLLLRHSFNKKELNNKVVVIIMCYWWSPPRATVVLVSLVWLVSILQLQMGEGLPGGNLYAGVAGQLRQQTSSQSRGRDQYRHVKPGRADHRIPPQQQHQPQHTKEEKGFRSEMVSHQHRARPIPLEMSRAIGIPLSHSEARQFKHHQPSVQHGLRHRLEQQMISSSVIDVDVIRNVTSRILDNSTTVHMWRLSTGRFERWTGL